MSSNAPHGQRGRTTASAAHKAAIRDDNIQRAVRGQFMLVLAVLNVLFLLALLLAWIL